MLRKAFFTDRKYYRHMVRRVELHFPYDENLVEDLQKSVPMAKFFKSGEERFWLAPLSIKTMWFLKQNNFRIQRGILKWYKQTWHSPEATKKIKGLRFPKELKNFQREGIRFLEAKNGRALIADEMGLGKTPQAIIWAKNHMPEAFPVLVVCPSNAKYHWVDEVSKWMGKQGRAFPLEGITPDRTQLPEKDDSAGVFAVINFDILYRWQKMLAKHGFKTLIVDECFPAGTKIATPKGSRNIEELKEGDEVYNATGTGKIRKRGCRVSKTLIDLHLSDGRKITTTPNHPFFTIDGWTAAQQTLRKKLFTSSLTLNILSKNKRSMNRNKEEEYEKNKKELRMVRKINDNYPSQKKILRNILLSEVEEQTTERKTKFIFKTKKRKNQQGSEKSTSVKSTMGATNIRENEKKQSHTKSRNNEESQKPLARIWPSSFQTTTKRWQWSAVAATAKSLMDRIRSKMESRISNSHKKAKNFWISYLLQSRYCTSRTKGMDRNRRMDAQKTRNPEKGQEKGKSFENPRVERITLHKRTGNERPTRCIVYNLQVSGHPSYFAEGVLVHNCQYIKNKKAQRTKGVKAVANSAQHIIALSGTPAENAPKEFFQIVNLINSGVFVNFFEFAEDYLIVEEKQIGRSKKDVVRKYGGCLDPQKLNWILTRTVMLRRLKKNVLPELAEKQRVVVPLSLSERSEYWRAERDFITWAQQQHPEKGLSSDSEALALRKMSALRQILIREKYTQCKEWIEEFLTTGQKLVVFTNFRNTVDMLMRDFPKISVKVDGSVSGKARNEAKKRFHSDETCSLFVGNIQAANTALDLTAASNTVTLELAFVPSWHDQAEDRVHRITQKARGVTAWYLLARNTIDTEIMTILDGKRVLLKEVMDGEKATKGELLQELMVRLTQKS